MSRGRRLKVSGAIALLLVGGIFFLTRDGSESEASLKPTPVSPLETTSEVIDSSPSSSTAKADLSETETAPLESSPPSITAHGLVIAFEGEPVAGAVIHWRPARTHGPRLGAPALSEPEHRSVSDHVGDFRLTDLPQRGSIDLFVRHDEFVGKFLKGVIPSEKLIVIGLEPGITHRGVVFDPSGNPVAGAVVSAVETMADGQIGVGNFTPFHRFETRSAGDGEFTLTVPAGIQAYAIGADHPEWGPSAKEPLGPRSRDVTLQLLLHLVVEGVVVDDLGQTIAGARVSHSWNPALQKSTVSDAAGEFRLIGLTPNREILDFSAPGHIRGYFDPRQSQRRSKIVEYPDLDLSEVELVLDREARVSGRIIDGAGAPIQNATVSYLEPFGGTRYLRDDRTDTEGSFSIGSLQSTRGMHSVIEVSHPEYEVIEIKEALALTPGKSVDLGERVLERAVPIRGRMTNAAGAPIAGASVQFMSESHFETTVVLKRRLNPNDRSVRHSRTEVSDSDGKFTFGSPGAGTYRVWARAAGYRNGSSDIIDLTDVDDSEAMGTISIVLEKAHSIVGTLVDPEGRPCPGLPIRARGPSPGSSDTTRADGTFSLDGLSKEEYSIHLGAAEWILEEAANQVIPGEKPIVIHAFPPGAIEATVIDGHTRLPIEGVRFSAHRDSGEVPPNSRGHVSGWNEVLVDPASVGDWQVLVSAKGYDSLTDTVRVASDETSVAVFALYRSAEIRGRVVDRLGHALRGASVRLGRGKFKATDKNGEFVFGDVPAETFTITALYPGLMRLDVPGIVVPPSGSVNLGTLVLTEGASIEGSLRLSDGSAPERADISVEVEGTQRKLIGSYDRQTHAYSIEGLPAGTFRLVFSYPAPDGLKTHTAPPIVLRDSEQRRFDVTLP